LIPDLENPGYVTAFVYVECEASTCRGLCCQIDERLRVDSDGKAGVGEMKYESAKES